MTRVTLMTLAALTLASPIRGYAQDLKRPDTWKVRLDRGPRQPVPDSLYYVSMPPGWHVTTRRHSGIFYDPAWTASGNFRITSTMFLFPDSRREGYGLFFGGRDLDGEGQAYIYVLLRKDGKYLVKRRQGSETHDITPWTEHPGVTKLPAEGQAKNVVVIEAGADRLRVLVNDQEIGTWDRSEVEGTVGLRVNHGVNLHVTDVKIEPLD